MRSIGGIPAAPRFSLQNHGLALVLCQVAFSPVLRIRQENGIVGFQEAIRKRYPGYVPQQGLQLIVTPDGVQQQSTAETQHRFEDSSGRFSVVLTSEFMAIESRSYSGIDEFSERVVELARAVQEHFDPNEVRRVGLRFVNELRLRGAEPAEDAARIINPALIGAAGASELAGVVAGSDAILSLGVGGDRMQVRHGLQPLGGTTVPPDVPDRTPSNDLALPFYLLDIDAFSADPRPYASDWISETLQRYNDDARSFFAWSVSEDYRTSVLGQGR